jgi:hypothetical protein
MRALLDWLDNHIEPYVSFRFVIGLVFTAIFLNWAIGLGLWLHEANRATTGGSPREQQLMRIAKNYAFVLLLRSVSWRNLRAHVGLMVEIVLLLLLAAGLATGVFATP